MDIIYRKWGAIMIFNDYVIQLNEKKVQLDRLESIIENFRKCLKLEGDWEYLAFKYAYSNMIDGSVNNNGAANSVGLCNKTNAYFLKLRSSLIGIDYVEFGEILSELQQNIADEFKEEINKAEKFKLCKECIGEFANRKQAKVG